MVLSIRYFYAPVFFAGFIGTAVWLVDNKLPSWWLIPMLVAAIGVSFLFEKMLPYEKLWNHNKGDSKRDAIHAVVNETSNIFAVSAIPIISFYTQGFNIWPEEWPLVFQLLMAIAIADFGITLMHYASHKMELLWRFHAIHHSVERMYSFNGLMKHPVHQAIELIAGTSPLLLLGMPMEVGILLAFSVAIQLLLQHSNVDMRLGYLIYIWAVAPGHRHHHIASKKDGNVNFGLFTMIWDHLLGTFVFNRPPPKEGQLGIYNRADYPKGYIDQFVEPFVR